MFSHKKINIQLPLILQFYKKQFLHNLWMSGCFRITFILLRSTIKEDKIKEAIASIFRYSHVLLV